MNSFTSNLSSRTYGFLLLSALCLIAGCTPHEKKLPYLGNPVVLGTKTIYPKIGKFSFINQSNEPVTNETFKGKIYVADFIFLSCPTICPKMTVEMKQVYEKYKNNTDVLFLSHTIDPEHDTVEKLNSYAKNLGVGNTWHFVTGNKDSILSLATKSYFTTAYKDAKEPGGYVHGGGLLLVDDKGYIRGVYDGTDTAETKRLVDDIGHLLNEIKD